METFLSPKAKIKFVGQKKSLNSVILMTTPTQTINEPQMEISW